MKTWKWCLLVLAIAAPSEAVSAGQVNITSSGKFLTIDQRSSDGVSVSYSIRKSVLLSVTITKGSDNRPVVTLTTGELVAPLEKANEFRPAVSKTYRLYPHSSAYAQVLRDEILSAVATP